MNWQPIFVIALLVLLIILYQIKRFPGDLLFLVGSLLTTIVGIVPAKEVLYSIINPTIVTLFSLAFIANSLEEQGFFQAIADSLFNLKKAFCFFFLGFFSGFFNPTYLFRYSASQASPTFLASLILIGTGTTLIGSPIILMLLGLIERTSLHPIPTFFELGAIGFPLLLLATFLGWGILRKKIDIKEEAIVSLSSPMIGVSVAKLPGKVLRKGEKLSRKEHLKEGDLLLYEPKRPFDFFPLQRVEEGKRNPLTLLIFLIALSLIIVGVSYALTSALAAFACLLCRVTQFKKNVRAIAWENLVYPMCGFIFFTAMQRSELASYLAAKCIFCQTPTALAALFLIGSSLLSLLLPGAITAALFFSVAMHLSLPLLPLFVAIALGCTLTFLTPRSNFVTLFAYALEKHSLKAILTLGALLLSFLWILGIWLIPKIWPLV
jgi:di/tricarboxylate transporter